jgi:NAD(P)H-hydrate epimerase
VNTDLLWTSEEIRAFERHLQDDLGLPALLLMENAAVAAAKTITQLSQDQGFTTILLLCGRGNNGGDAATTARHLIGTELHLLLATPLGQPRPGSLSEAALLTCARLGLTATSQQDLPTRIASADLLVDGLFGTGLDRPLAGHALQIIRDLDAASRPLLALDLPSGLDATTGAVLGAALHAHWTLTFAGVKAGLVRGAGPAHAGEVRLAPIGVSEGVARAWLARRRAATR